MAKSKNRSRSELEHLRGQVRELKAKLKYYERRADFLGAPLEDVLDEHDLNDMNASECEVCGKGLMIEFDFVYATLARCNHCGNETRKRKT